MKLNLCKAMLFLFFTLSTWCSVRAAPLETPMTGEQRRGQGTRGEERRGQGTREEERRGQGNERRGGDRGGEERRGGDRGTRGEERRGEEGTGDERRGDGRWGRCGRWVEMKRNKHLSQASLSSLFHLSLLFFTIQSDVWCHSVSKMLVAKQYGALEIFMLPWWSFGWNCHEQGGISLASFSHLNSLIFDQ